MFKPFTTIGKRVTPVSLAFAALFGVAAAADADVERLKEDAKAVGEAYAEEGKRIADDAVDFANRVADNFTEAYEQGKHDARDSD